jgi:pyridoxal phosphate-dependent aminotransferase EpsN
MHVQPLYRDAERVRGEVAADLFQRGICLPSSTNMTVEHQTLVIEVIRGVATKAVARR